MSSGFNTDVSHSGRILHIQTEDRGPTHPVIDTTVYQNGHVLFRKTLSYVEFAASPAFTIEWLRGRVAEHHRTVIEDLRAGLFDAEIADAAERAPQDHGVRVQLLNPGSWLSAGSVFLEIQVLRRSDSQPQASAQVEASIEGALHNVRNNAQTDDQGCAQMRFPLPPLGKGELALVISARAGGAPDEIRFSMRSKPKDAPSETLPPAASKA
jgi:hypothetical protein